MDGYAFHTATQYTWQTSWFIQYPFLSARHMPRCGFNTNNAGWSILQIVTLHCVISVQHVSWVALNWLARVAGVFLKHTTDVLICSCTAALASGANNLLRGWHWHAHPVLHRQHNPQDCTTYVRRLTGIWEQMLHPLLKPGYNSCMSLRIDGLRNTSSYSLIHFIHYTNVRYNVRHIQYTVYKYIFFFFSFWRKAT